MRHAAIALCLALAGGAVGLSKDARAEPPPEVKLAGRYTNSLNGFSLRPPADTERIRQTSARRIVAWNRRDERTHAMRWSLEVLRTHHAPTDKPLKEYAQTIARELGAEMNFKVESTDLSTVGGKEAMHFRGLWRGALQLWRRETWVQLAPGEYLVLDIAGTVPDKAEMDATLSAVADSLNLFDPAEARKDRLAALQRGAGVMDGLTEERLKTLAAAEPQYFLISRDGEIVGFLKISEGFARRADATGLRVVRDGALKLSKFPRQLIHEELFSTPIRRVEWWCRAVVEGGDDQAIGTLTECLKQDDGLLLQTRSKAGPPDSSTFEVPAAIRAAYLPQAFAVMLPRLIDRDKPLAYGFAVFNDIDRGFDLRTVRVIGPDKAIVGGKTHQAVKLTDQMADDAPLTELWVDKDGSLLKMATPEGWTIERADRAGVIGRFSAELLELGKVVDKLPDSVRTMGPSATSGSATRKAR